MESAIGREAVPGTKPMASPVESGKARRRPWWKSQPSASFLRDPYFYFKYDLKWLGVFSAVIVAAHATGWSGLGLEWDSWWAIPALLIGCYVQVLAGVFIHNCTHENFPRPVNRLIGELLGIIVGTRYASWEILHRRHHMYSDDEEKDPHPANPGFWRFFWFKMIANLEKNIRQQHVEQFGDSPRWHKLDHVRTALALLVGAAMFAFWHAVLGTVGFVYVFLPSLVFGAIHVSHFNWATHRGWADDGDYRPVNLDHGLYKLGNFLCFGLYFHANHHAFVKFFNPGKLPADKAARVEKKLAASAAK